MRHCYIVVYDISDKKRVKKVFKTMKEFGDHTQLSVFLCRLDLKSFREMQKKLNAVIEEEEDQIIFFNLGPENMLPRMDITHMGRSPVLETRNAIIV
jgi:CRISPR-associated protein Cas2